ncbi:MAG: diguanylate cyclase [Paracoccaceae bacterium]
MSGRILIIDDVATNRIVLKVKLEAVFYTVLLAASGAEGLQMARTERPDLILLDLLLPDLSGRDVLAQLRADPNTAGTPVIILSSTHDPDARMAALAAGADDFLTKPLADTVLLARLRNLLRAQGGDDGYTMVADALSVPGLAEANEAYVPPARIALISDRPEQTIRWRRELPRVFPGNYAAQTLEQALLASDGQSGDDHDAKDIYLIDASMGHGNGVLNFVSDLRSRGPSRHAAICVIGAAITSDRMAMAYDLGANDVILSDVPLAEIGLRLQTMLTRKRAADRARASVNDGLRMAMIDPLTGLYNRRYAMPHLTRVAEAARLDGSVFAVMVVDLDRFKSVNDRLGHSAGDVVLAKVAKRLASNLRTGDMVARIGGEEFLVVLPDTSFAEAQIAAERLCKVVREKPVVMDDGVAVEMSISIGLAFSGAAETVAALIDVADQALLRSKSAGRNRVTICQNAA